MPTNVHTHPSPSFTLGVARGESHLSAARGIRGGRVAFEGASFRPYRSAVRVALRDGPCAHRCLEPDLGCAPRAAGRHTRCRRRQSPRAQRDDSRDARADSQNRCTARRTLASRPCAACRANSRQPILAAYNSSSALAHLIWRGRIPLGCAEAGRLRRAAPTTRRTSSVLRVVWHSARGAVGRALDGVTMPRPPRHRAASPTTTTAPGGASFATTSARMFARERGAPPLHQGYVAPRTCAAYSGAEAARARARESRRVRLWDMNQPT